MMLTKEEKKARTSAYRKLYYAKNREKILARQREANKNLSPEKKQERLKKFLVYLRKRREKLSKEEKTALNRKSYLSVKARMEKDPEYAKHKSDVRKEWYKRNRDKVLVKSKERKATLTEEERLKINKRQREYQRKKLASLSPEELKELRAQQKAYREKRKQEQNNK